MTEKTGLDFEILFFEQVVNRSPNYVHALIPLAEAYTRKGEYQKGLDVDRRLAQLRDTDPIVFYNLGCSYALLGENEEAIKALRQAIKLGYRDMEHMRRDKDLKKLHGLSAFDDLFRLPPKIPHKKK